MSRSHRFAFALWASAAFTSASAVALPKLGEAGGNASMEDADGRRTSVNAFRGKPILIVYEDKDSATVNQAMKDDLAKLAKGDRYKDAVALLPLADVSSYNFWPVKGFVKDAIREESQKVGATIYCDWDGSFRSAFDIRVGSSSIILIGKSGTVRFAQGGALSAAQREELIGLLKEEVEG